MLNVPVPVAPLPPNFARLAVRYRRVVDKMFDVNLCQYIDRAIRQRQQPPQQPSKTCCWLPMPSGWAPNGKPANGRAIQK